MSNAILADAAPVTQGQAAPIFTHYPNIRSHRTSSITFGRMLQIIGGEHTRQLTAKARALKADGDKAGYARIKTDAFPVLMAGGLYAGRRGKNLRQASGYLSLDLDEGAVNVAEIKARAPDMPEIALVAESVGGDAWALVRVANAVGAGNAGHFQSAVIAWAQALGLPASTASAGTERGRFLAYDPEPYINLDAVPLLLPDAPAKPAAQTRNPDAPLENPAGFTFEELAAHYGAEVRGAYFSLSTEICHGGDSPASLVVFRDGNKGGWNSWCFSNPDCRGIGGNRPRTEKIVESGVKGTPTPDSTILPRERTADYPFRALWRHRYKCPEYGRKRFAPVLCADGTPGRAPLRCNEPGCADCLAQARFEKAVRFAACADPNGQTIVTMVDLTEEAQKHYRAKIISRHRLHVALTDYHFRDGRARWGLEVIFDTIIDGKARVNLDRWAEKNNATVRDGKIDRKAFEEKLPLDRAVTDTEERRVQTARFSNSWPQPYSESAWSFKFRATEDRPPEPIEDVEHDCGDCAERAEKHRDDWEGLAADNARAWCQTLEIEKAPYSEAVAAYGQRFDRKGEKLLKAASKGWAGPRQLLYHAARAGAGRIPDRPCFAAVRERLRATAVDDAPAVAPAPVEPPVNPAEHFEHEELDRAYQSDYIRARQVPLGVHHPCLVNAMAA